MKPEIKKLIGVAGIIFGLYLAIRYWAKVEGLILLGFSAAIPLIIGCVIAYIVNILMGFYEVGFGKLFPKLKRMMVKRIICLVLAFFSMIAIIFFAIYMVLPELINCIASFVKLIPGLVEEIVAYTKEEQLLERIPILQETLDRLNSENIGTTIEQLWNTFKGSLGGAVGSIMSAVSSVFSSLIGVVVGLIFSIYIMLDKERLSTRCKILISTYMPKRAERIFYIGQVFNESFHNFIVGQCTEAIVLGVLCIIGMALLRIPYAVMIGVFIGFTALIPIAGAYIGAAVGAIMILTVSPFKALEFLIFILILQQIEGNLIYPKVVGKSIGLPGIWVLTAITLGGGILGIPGMLLAVPLFSAGYRLLKEDVTKRGLSRVSEQKGSEFGVESISPIARIHTEFPDKFGIPRQSGLVPTLRGEIVLEPGFRNPDAIRGIEEFSHLWLIWEFSKAKQENVALTVTPPRLGGKEKKGVFATRAPYRPNSLGLSSVKLEEVYLDDKRGPVLVVSGADLMDGTPIYDIKPYLPYTDSHPEAMGSFGENHKEDRIEVNFPQELLEKLPKESRQSVLDVLRQDPRAAYNKKPDYVYGMRFGSCDIRFTVQDEVLTVQDVVDAEDAFRKVK